MNELEHLEEFNDILKNYHVSEAGEKILQQTTLVLCSAPTATGRNTIIRELVKSNKYYFIISDTTRKPRINDGVQEQNGVEYWFRTEAQMLEELKAGKLLEAEVIHAQQVSGISIREIEKAQTQQQVAITDADSGGIKIVTKVKPDTICIFFLPPNFEEWQRRIDSRGAMDPTEKRRRLTTAIQEIEFALGTGFHKFVINDDLAEAVARVDAIVADPSHADVADQEQARALAQELLQKTKDLLND